MPAEGDNQSGLQQELQFRKALVSLTNELLSSRLSPDFYQTALERTVALVPDAQAGSVLVRHDDGLFHFEAAVEFEFSALRSITMSDAEMGKRSRHTEIEKIEIHDYHSRIGDEKISQFGAAGRLEDIRATLSVPLVANDEIMGYFNLDNFESHDAFTGTDVEVAEALASQVSLALYRLRLERSLKKEREHFEQMAHQDSLTGLPNRRFFLDALTRSLAAAERRGSRLGLLFIDLDDFKRINDDHGHAAGDRVLVETGRRICACVRSGDIPARLAGDEFGVLLIDLVDVADGAQVAEKIGQVLEEEVPLDGGSLRPRASIGVVTYPEDGTVPEQLLTGADKAMYGVKARRKRLTS